MSKMVSVFIVLSNCEIFMQIMHLFFVNQILSQMCGYIAAVLPGKEVEVGGNLILLACFL